MSWHGRNVHYPRTGYHMAIWHGSYETLQSGSEEVQKSAACRAWSLVEHCIVTLHRCSAGPVVSPQGASQAVGVKQSLGHLAEPIYMQTQYNGIRYLKKSAEMVKEPLLERVYACMQEHSVGAEWQVGNQQVISTDSVPFPSQRQVRLDRIHVQLQMLLWKNVAPALQSSF